MAASCGLLHFWRPILDRQIIYPGQIPLETDLLNTNRNMMVALSKFSGALVGTQTIANGLACTPNSPAALTVLVGPGELYSLQNLDGTAYSSLAADTTHQIVKQGISLDTVTLSCPAPVTAGFSVNYLIEAAYQDVDSTSVALPYYNATNPSQAYSGPGNTGVTQSTQRKGTVVLTAKAGTAAATGSQTTPSPDAGNVGLFVVTVANGQSTITSTSIAAYGAAPTIPSLLKVRQLANSITDPAFGGVSGSDVAAATTAAALAGTEIVFPPGAWPMSTTPTVTGSHVLTALPGATFSGAGATALGFTAGALRQQIQMNTSGSDFANQYFRRNANHSGGSPTSVSNCLNVATYVTNAGATNLEWAFTAYMNNSATAGQNVAAYMQAVKNNGAGATWGADIELIESTATNNPTTGSVALELDMSVNGTDSLQNRVGCDLVVRKYNAGGAAAVAGWGFRVQAGGSAGSLVTAAFGIGSGMSATYGLDTSQGTVVTAAVRMAAGQPIAFDAGAVNQLNYDGTGLQYKVSGSSASRLNADGSIQFGGAALGIKLSGTTAGTATAGVSGAPPAQVVGYLTAVVTGTTVKIPYYAN